jgi:replicative DNA helicase
MSDSKPTGRSMPANLDAERAILSSILRDSGVLAKVGDVISADDFYLEAHRLIYQALTDLDERGLVFDSVTLAEELHGKALLDRVGGPQYIGDIIDYVGTTSGATSYARIVRDKAQIRRMIHAATEIATEGFSDTIEVREFLDRAERRVFEVLENTISSQAVHIREPLRDAINALERLAAAEERITGVTSGYVELDKLLLGLHPSDLVIIAARPAMGKTSFAMNVATNAALLANAAVAVFSLEMSRDQLALRLLASEARVGLKSLRGGFITDTDWPKLADALRRLSASRIYVDDVRQAGNVSLVRVGNERSEATPHRQGGGGGIEAKPD